MESRTLVLWLNTLLTGWKQKTVLLNQWMLLSYLHVQAGQSHHGGLDEIPSAPGVPVDNIDYALATTQRSKISTRTPKKYIPEEGKWL